MQRDVSRASSNITNTFNKLLSTIKKVFSVAVIVNFGKKIAELGETAVKSAASVQASTAQFEQTFGSLQNQASAAIKKVADESGILQTRLQGVGTSIYAFAKTTGMDSASALSMMQEALQVTADSAAYYDRSLEDTAESLKSFLKGNYANDAALGLSCTETTRNTAANKLYGKSFMDLSEAQKQLTLLQMVKDANELSGALGQAKRESDGWENVTGNLNEAWNQLLAVVSKPILQGTITVIKNVTNAISTLTEYAQAAVGALSDLFGWGTEEENTNAKQAASNNKKISDSISASTSNQNKLTAAVAKTNAETKRGLASFDRLNLLTKNTVAQSGNDGSSTNNSNSTNSKPLSIDVDTKNAKNKVKDLKEHIIKTFEHLYEVSGMKKFQEHLEHGWNRVDRAYINSNVANIGQKTKKIVTETTPHIINMNKSAAGLAGTLAGIGATLAGKSAETMTGGVSKWLDRDTDYIIETTNEVTDNIGSGFQNLTFIFEDAGDKLGYLLDLIKPYAEKAIEISLTFTTHVVGEAAKFFSGIFEKGTKNLAISYDITTKFISGDIELKDFLPSTKKYLKEQVPLIEKEVFDNWDTILKDLQTKINNLPPKIKKWFKEKFIAPIKNFDASELGEEIGKRVGDTFTYVWGVVSTFFSETVPQTVTQASKYFKSLPGKIKDFIFESFPKLVEAGQEIVNGLWEGMSAIWEKAWEFVDGLIKGVKEGLGIHSPSTVFAGIGDNIIEGLLNRLKSTWEKISSFFSSAWSKITDGASQAWEGIKEPFKNVSDWFKDTFANAWEKIKDVFSKGGEIFNGIKDGISSTFKNIVNGLIDGINSIIKDAFSKLNTAISKLKNANILGFKPFEGMSTFETPQIPKLAKGGFVTAPTLAIVGDNAGAGSGDPEVISPLSKLQGMINQSSGQDTVLLNEILVLLKRFYEMFVVYKNSGGNTRNVERMPGYDEIFDKLLERNERYKNAHNGVSAFA